MTSFSFRFWTIKSCSTPCKFSWLMRRLSSSDSNMILQELKDLELLRLHPFLECQCWHQKGHTSYHKKIDRILVHFTSLERYFSMDFFQQGRSTMECHSDHNSIIIGLASNSILLIRKVVDWFQNTRNQFEVILKPGIVVIWLILLEGLVIDIST